MEGWFHYIVLQDVCQHINPYFHIFLQIRQILQLCQYKNIINCLDCNIKILVRHTYDNIQLGGTLINHLDIHIGMG